MKDALGHGSAAHQTATEQVGRARPADISAHLHSLMEDNEGFDKAIDAVAGNKAIDKATMKEIATLFTGTPGKAAFGRGKHVQRIKETQALIQRQNHRGALIDRLKSW